MRMDIIINDKYHVIFNDYINILCGISLSYLPSLFEPGIFSVNAYCAHHQFGPLKVSYTELHIHTGMDNTRSVTGPSQIVSTRQEGHRTNRIETGFTSPWLCYDYSGKIQLSGHSMTRISVWWYERYVWPHKDYPPTNIGRHGISIYCT